VDLEKATAQLKDGVLEVRLAKKGGVAPKAKKITVA
jgi:HSP20 family molecular chaperone IbpA